MVGSLFDGLPVEIKIQVMENLDAKSLLRCASVSWSMYLTFRSSSLLQYLVKLALYGMEETGSGVPHPNVSPLLDDHRRAWELLDWKRTTTIEVAPHCQAYELVADVFASSDGSKLSIVGLPSSRSDGYTMTRTPDVPFRDFAIDPTQDIVAFLEVSIQSAQRIHVRNISTNAPLIVLGFTIPPNNNFKNPVLQFGQDLLGLYYTSRILIWNWQQGSLIFDSSLEKLSHHIDHFVFLSRDALLVTSTALHLYVFNPPSSVTLVATLHLPVTPHHRLGAQIKVHSGPLHARPPPGALFTPSSGERIQVLSVGYGLNLKYTMYVHTRTLLHYVKQYRSGKALPELVVPWDLWGPRGTRFMKRDAQGVWLRYAHGQRVIRQRDTVSGTEIDVIDFNYIPSSSSSGSSSDLPVNPFHGDSFRRTTVTRSQPTVLAPSTSGGLGAFSAARHDSPFVTEISTSLPYHVSSVSLPLPLYACMIDDERVIGVQMDHADIKLVVYSL
ncbi:hypothetical protein M413DRAFT_449469 [Hebeloma cylindrosporum]|uniref:F-box domain-containing protein n=1 Tax=Hebeloma cylindrosporum TaxID=76867 RepID=A0A0C3BX33_HEBCY|nr:hypothetical protein M413DRAFT_449469 [Hebeloma cylindrosporum h7]